MKRWLLLMVLMLFLIFMPGCDHGLANTGPVRQVSSYSEKVFDIQGKVLIDVDISSVNIEVYCWDKKQVKLESGKLMRGRDDDGILDNRLDKCKIDMKEKKVDGLSKIILKASGSSQGGSISGEINLKLYVPKSTTFIVCTAHKSFFKFYDDMRFNMKFEVKNTDIDINRLGGEFCLNGKESNITMGGGLLKGQSNINLESGNISLRADFDAEGTYSFETGSGNISIEAPSNCGVGFESIGDLEANEFLSPEYPGLVRLASRFGRISIRKY